VVDPLGIRDAIGIVPKIFETGTGADRQLKAYEKNKSLIDVVDYIHDQFLLGVY
jgi:carboxylate-amine ligase